MKWFFFSSTAAHLLGFGLFAQFLNTEVESKTPTPFVDVLLSASPTPDPSETSDLDELKNAEKKIKRKLRKVQKYANSKGLNKAATKQSDLLSQGEVEKQKLLYKEELRHFLQNNYRYPPMAAKLKQSGPVRVKIKINQNGSFESVFVSKPSRFKLLNDGTIAFLNSIAQFKPLPKELASEIFEVPIIYEL